MNRNSVFTLEAKLSSIIKNDHQGQDTSSPPRPLPPWWYQCTNIQSSMQKDHGPARLRVSFRFR
jgi:hypothetical protein